MIESIDEKETGRRPSIMAGERIIFCCSHSGLVHCGVRLMPGVVHFGVTKEQNRPVWKQAEAEWCRR